MIRDEETPRLEVQPNPLRITVLEEGQAPTTQGAKEETIFIHQLNKVEAPEEMQPIPSDHSRETPAFTLTVGGNYRGPAEQKAQHTTKSILQWYVGKPSITNQPRSSNRGQSKPKEDTGG